ncbi:MAG TPA: membrane protein insertase YidC [Spirochaetota bacterium]|nr:membrane protein insertase YidC [Spirochaetota bacterium]
MGNKNLIIAIVLSLVIWIAWGQFFGKKPVPQATQVVAEAESKKDASQPKADEKTDTTEKTETKKVQKVSTKTPAVETKNSIKVKNYNAVLSNKGARIESIKYGEKQIELVAGREKLDVKGYLDFPVYFSDKELLSGSSLDDEIWEVKKAEGNEVVYALTAEINGKNIVIEKSYLFNNETHSFDVSFRITNTSADEFEFPSGSIYLTSPDFLGPQIENYEGYYNAPSTIYALSEDPEDLEKGKKGGGWFSDETDTKEGKNPVWAGVSSRFISLVMIPQNFKADAVKYDSRKTPGHRTALVSSNAKLKSGETAERKIKVALAEKNKDILLAVDKSIVPAVDINKWIEPIRWVVLKILFGINGVFGNLGVSIILLSILTKLIFLPLTIKSTNSMKKMSELSPKMAELKIKYKDKPQELQKEMMALYKNAGVNPLGGCLPLIIQMPFFFALYSALSNSIDMWRAPFFFWMKDLSMPDTVGHLMGLNLNILPLIMVVTSFLQQKMTTMDTGNPQQKMMMMLMPVMFLFFFWSMPSGLVIYWIVQNALQIAHQLYITRKPAKTVKAGGTK